MFLKIYMTIALFEANHDLAIKYKPYYNDIYTKL